MREDRVRYNHIQEHTRINDTDTGKKQRKQKWNGKNRWLRQAMN